MEEHLQEVRCLRQRLEESIRTNERLRQQLEERLATTGRDGGTGALTHLIISSNVYDVGFSYFKMQNNNNKNTLNSKKSVFVQGHQQTSIFRDWTQ